MGGEVVIVHELLDRCPKCVDRDGNSPQLILITDNRWSEFEHPQFMCSNCGTRYKVKQEGNGDGRQIHTQRR